MTSATPGEPSPATSASARPSPTAVAAAARRDSAGRLLLWALGVAGLTLLLGLTGLAWARPVPVAPAGAAAPDVRPREAGQKGLDWLLSSAVSWQHSQGCYGCHVQSFALMGAGIGQKNGYQIDPAQARELADFLVGIQASQGYITTGDGRSIASGIQTVLAGIGLSQYDEQAGGTYRDPLVRMADWLVAQQAGDGRWQIDREEAPVNQGNALMTGGALLTIAAAQRHDPKPAYQTAIERGAQWLRGASLSTTQDIVFAIIGLKAAGADDRDAGIVQLIDLLRSRQRADGGWGETTRLGSNGYATGQALYAYKLVGIPIRDESFQRGALWLLENQSADGSWRQVNSQQRKSSRSSNFATTMWAAIGLGQVFDVQTEAEFLSLIHPDRQALTLPAVGLFYLLPLLLIGPLLWRRQARYWLAARREGRPRGGRE